MEEYECMVCFSHYDDDKHRPRCMPCGHTMCSKCLEKAIKEDSKMCPKCRRHFLASNLNDLPVNFSLESLVKLMNIQKCTQSEIVKESVEHQLPVNQRPSEVDKLPECVEHQLPLSSRCSTHKSWICESCINEEHSPQSCKIITITEELNIKKSRQFEQSSLLLNIFKESCNKSDDCRKHFKKLIEENDKEVLKYESWVKILQDTIQETQSKNMQMVNSYSIFDQKMKTLKDKRSNYDEAVKSLLSSETIRGVSSCSVEVQNEAKKLQSISKEMDNEVELMKQAIMVGVPRFELFLDNHKLSVRDGLNHLHAVQKNNLPKNPSINLEFTDDSVTDGAMTFIDLAVPGQQPKRIYMRMLGNTARSKQHLHLSTGRYGHSYKGLKFYSPYQSGNDIIIHPYDGIKAEVLVKDLEETDDAIHMRTAGMMHGASWVESGNNNNALFGIYLNDDQKHLMDKTVFGIVTSGLEMLQGITNSYVSENIEVIDCGIIFYYPLLGPI